MTDFSAGHRCPGCGGHRVERRGLHGWTVLLRLNRHAYHCLDCDRRFWDRQHRRQSYAPPVAVAQPDDETSGHRRHRRRPRWRVKGTPETTPYSRPRAYLLIGLGWLVLLALFFALRAFWPAADALVRAVD